MGLSYKLMRILKFVSTGFVSLATALLFGVPSQGAAQVLVNPIEPVPVPWNPLFFWGPAGRLTASGLIIGLIEIALWIVGLISVLFVIIGGFRYVTASGNEEAAEGAKKTILHAILGIVIVILSFVIIRVIATALTLGSPFGV